EFDSNIVNFKIIGGDTPACKIIDRDGYYDLGDSGDGLKHYISIICALYACEDGYLFIDEIDNGIHYTQLDRLWEIILTISKEQNVRVFATTHSKECIESYARVAKKLEDEDISFIELGKDKNNELKAMTFPYEWFIDEIEQNHEVRGW
ncbi:MAG: ATP-binding protein, partial [Campylobacterales bacterium]|nr:ATP-binding protein [Campylobacterales bacterium]